MEGVGSRLGRASSRYGPTPVFTGPVRRWKKQWVHVSSLSHPTTTTFNGNGTNNNNAKAVRLPRWTPVSSTSSSSSDAAKSEEEPPRRKLRYTPIVMLEGKKKNAAKGADVESRASKTCQLLTSETMERDDVDKQAIDNKEETEISDRKRAAPKPLSRSRIDLDLSLNDQDGEDDSDGENNYCDWGRANQN